MARWLSLKGVRGVGELQAINLGGKSASPVDVDDGSLSALGHGRIRLERFDPKVAVEVLFVHSELFCPRRGRKYTKMPNHCRGDRQVSKKHPYQSARRVRGAPQHQPTKLPARKETLQSIENEAIHPDTSKKTAMRVFSSLPLGIKHTKRNGDS